ncbi:hypothetical protein BDP27DRAFT_1291093 [Rhodocollybia butyracea]|uniref:Uncharacterized protein n=1 Tax=Rhodocollybia butyracea TaxID=206335 RepID=A0A9P5Q112_9AGAR|nr:hypothetical protein BDP27DRAFT_1291093 [Rhodocollybia butyracea]
MAEENEDTVPLRGYKYAWSPFMAVDINIKDFLDKFRPSMVENDGTKPWIWVDSGRRDDEDALAQTAKVTALEEAKKTLEEITTQIEAIKNDPAIPTRSNKKTGAKSKKELREELQASAREKFKVIAEKYQYFCGKWLIFASSEKVDMIWKNLANSLIEGPLANTKAFCVKVSTFSSEPNYRHVICLYLPNVYDKNEVTKVMKILIGDYGVNLTGVKSDMYTLIGVNSKHPSGIPSTIWRNTDLMSEKEMQELKAGHTKADARTKDSDNTGASTSVPNRLASKKKKQDVFASDDEDDEGEQRRKDALAKKKQAVALTKTATKRTNVSDDESEDKDAKRQKR